MSLSTVAGPLARYTGAIGHWLLLSVCTAMTIVMAACCPAAVLAETVEGQQVAFNRDDKADALRHIPYQQLDAASQAKVANIVQNPSMFRRLPVQVIDCDQEMYQFLVENPEVVVSIWQLMGITTVEVERVQPNLLHANDGAGTVTSIRVAYADETTRLLIAEGYYEGPMAPGRISAQCVLLLKSGFTQTDYGRDFVSNRLDVFVKFDNKGADILVKTLHPFIGKTTDHNFAETTGFLAKISKNSEENVAGMRQLAHRLEGLRPEVRQEFVQVVDRVHTRGLTTQAKIRQRGSASTTATAPAQEPGRFQPDDEGQVVRPLNVPVRATISDVTQGPERSARMITDPSPIPRKQVANLRR